VGFWTGKQKRLTAAEEVRQLMEPVERKVEHQLKLIAEAKEALTKLRGLIGETCQDCHHAKYCQHKANYDFNQDWILGCQYWTPDTRTNKDDVTRFIGKVV
jgi:hypothetical protein